MIWHLNSISCVIDNGVSAVLIRFGFGLGTFNLSLSL